jgi:hypothetical protein
MFLSYLFVPPPTVTNYPSTKLTDAKALTQWGLSGPTIFAQMIHAAAALAQGALDEAKTNGSAGAYTILLIITDGEISDMEATKEAIVAASALPLSIVIIGVGDTDFGKMVRKRALFTVSPLEKKKVGIKKECLPRKHERSIRCVFLQLYFLITLSLNFASILRSLSLYFCPSFAGWLCFHICVG